jgi:hypothetical protein
MLGCGVHNQMHPKNIERIDRSHKVRSYWDRRRHSLSKTLGSQGHVIRHEREEKLVALCVEVFILTITERTMSDTENKTRAVRDALDRGQTVGEVWAYLRSGSAPGGAGIENSQ